MNRAEQVMIEIINNKCDHARDFMDGDDIETAQQVLEEIQDFCKYLYEGKLEDTQVTTQKEAQDLFDAIVTRKLL